MQLGAALLSLHGRRKHGAAAPKSCPSVATSLSLAALTCPLPSQNQVLLPPLRLQAWLVTKVPAPRVEGYTAPPSRTACRLIAAQEMQK